MYKQLFKNLKIVVKLRHTKTVPIFWATLYIYWVRNMGRMAKMMETDW